MLKEASLGIKEDVKKTTLHLQDNQDVPSKAEVAFHTSIEHASHYVNEKERLDAETSEGFEIVFIEHEVVDKIVGTITGDKRKIIVSRQCKYFDHMVCHWLKLFAFKE